MNKLEKGMYVRFPYDFGNMSDPRDFLMGRVENINEITQTVRILIYDPFEYGIYFNINPGIYECPVDKVERCSAYKGARVVYNHRIHTVLCYEMKDDRYVYWLQRNLDKNIIKAAEADIAIPFSCMHISPLVQMKNYELQNPQWFLGRSVVTRSINVLENSISGFTELAGCKIELLPHQLAVILRCMQSEHCRYMLADEVGMGKTIEALGILKIYFSNHANKSVLIVVPSSLKEQWKSEMLFKFDLSDSMNSDNNTITLISPDELTSALTQEWDFLIIDEAHHYLSDEKQYAYLKYLSSKTDNLLLLSATPVQEKVNEYLKLASLLSPEYYDHMSIDTFKNLMNRQIRIVGYVHDIYSALADFRDVREELNKNHVDAHNDEEAEEVFEEIIEGIKDLSNFLNDPKITEDLMNITFEQKNFSIARIQALLVYITERYQISANIIRTRRSILQERIAQRELETIPYDILNSDDQFEYRTYSLLYNWVKGLNVSEKDFVNEIFPLLKSFFSSSFAFKNKLNHVICTAIPDELLKETENWVKYESIIKNDVLEAMDGEERESRLLKVFQMLDAKIRSEKVVLFTDFPETLQFYSKCMNDYFGKGSTAVYSSAISENEREVAVYHFQNDKHCNFLLCDASGGEGKNFQIADYIVHLDLPWNASDMEQRIGRLDRLGRDVDKPVISLVLYEPDTLEESIFDMFNKGLNVFTKSLSGLEIIMDELNRIILNSIKDDMNYGLKESIDRVIQTADKMSKAIKAEQIFDIAGYKFSSLNRKIDDSIQNLYRQDTDLFYSAMEGWAALTGFQMNSPEDEAKDTISFSRNKFSYNSARNTLLIPPDWSRYQNDKRSAHIEEIQQIVGKKGKSNVQDGMWIRGTFNRSVAIRSDYLHFFAPGDPIFDCIVKNAINSYKGTCSAIKIHSALNWQGLLFTFKYIPDYTVLYENGINQDRINGLLGYLECTIGKAAISFDNSDQNSLKDVLKEINKLISPVNLFHDTVIHLGRRSIKNALPIAKQYHISNAEYFREMTGENQWPSWVDLAYRKALDSITKGYKKTTRLDLAKNEMETMLSVKIETSGMKKEEIEKAKHENELMLAALQHARPQLDSVLFVWMSKDETN